MNFSRRAITHLIIILGLSGLISLHVTILHATVKEAIAAAAMTPPSHASSELHPTKATAEPLKPDYTEALIRFLGVLGAFVVVIRMNRRRQ